MDTVAIMMARGILRFGSFVSSAIGAAASKPEKASRVKTEPAMTPLHPLKPGALAYLGVNVDSVLWPPALNIKTMERTVKTTISMQPRIVAVLADVRIPSQTR